LFGSVVVIVFQSVFHAEIHQNDIFFIFKKLFLRSAHQNDPKYKKILNLKKYIFFLKTQAETRIDLRFQTLI
jgi:hypothetical protein